VHPDEAAFVGESSTGRGTGWQTTAALRVALDIERFAQVCRCENSSFLALLPTLTNRIGGNIQVESEAVGRMIIRDVDT
jgi:hypothetical protein